MANKDLENKYYTCPDNVIDNLRGNLNKYSGFSNIGGYKRAKGIVDNNRISYQQMKRIKNYFDNYEGSGDNIEYIMNGGDPMKEWVNNALGSSRDALYNMKKLDMESGRENSFRKTHEKDGNRNPTKVGIPKLHKGSANDNITNNRTVYESCEHEINKIKYLMTY